MGWAARHFEHDRCRAFGCNVEAMDLADLIERNAAFTPDKAAIRFARDGD